MRWRERREYRAATRRWAEHNAEMDAAQRCQCGARGTIRQTMCGAYGAAQPVRWLCNEHAAVPPEAAWMSNDGGRTWTTRHGCSREECSSMQFTVRTGIITYCDCGTHVGERRS